MPPLPEAIILVLAPFAPIFALRVWPHVQLLLLGAMLACGRRTETAALRVMGLSGERHLTNYHRVLNRVTWSARQVGRILLGLLASYCVSPGAPLPSRAAAGVGRSRLTAMAIRFALVCDPEGKLWMGAFFCTDLQGTPVQILEWGMVVMRWSFEVTFAVFGELYAGARVHAISSRGESLLIHSLPLAA